MSLDTDLQIKLQSLAGAGVPVQQNYNAEDDTQPRVWYQRNSDTTDLFASGADTLLRDCTFTIEVNSLDPDAGFAIAEIIQQGMNGFRGLMVRSRILACFAGNASDDYQFRNLDLDDGYHAFAFELRFIL